MPTTFGGEPIFFDANKKSHYHLLK
ncbi:hypothetical protein [Staphylococcus aureus]